MAVSSEPGHTRLFVGHIAVLARMSIAAFEHLPRPGQWALSQDQRCRSQKIVARTWVGKMLDETGLANHRPAYYQDLIAYLANPADQRTQKEFAEDHGVAHGTIVSYLCNHRQELCEMADKMRPRYLSQLRMAAFKNVYAALKSSYQDRRLALQLTGDLVEQTKTDLNFKTPDEKRAAIAQLMAGLSEKLARPGPDNPLNNGQNEKSAGNA